MTLSASVLIGGRCKHCGRTQPFGDLRGDEAEGYTCVICLEWHRHALLVLAGAAPRGCQECGVTFEQLRQQGNGSAKMILVPKDGIYQVLCPPCERPYAASSGIYRGTLYEHLKQLRGYK